MKRATITLSLETQERLKRLASQMHTARICVMHKALRTYAKALRKKRIRKSNVRCVQLGSKTTMSLEERVVLRALLRSRRKL